MRRRLSQSSSVYMGTQASPGSAPRRCVRQLITYVGVKSHHV